MTDQNLLLQEGGYPNAPDIKDDLRNSEYNASPYGRSLLNSARERIEHLERELAAKDRRIAHLTNPQFIRHRGNGVSLNCKRSTIDLFVSRAIENKDKPEPTQEEIAAFWNAIDAAMKDKP